MGIQETTVWNGILRSVFSFLDGIVFSLIKWIMYGIFDLSKITANTDIFNGIYSRIYVILGIFMAFKLSFSFFQYIIDPESMTGKSEKGVSKLLTRVIVMLGALILLPGLLFGAGGEEGLIYTAQRSLLPVLPRLIFGSNAGGNFEDSVEDSAENITVAIMNGFVSVPENIDEYCPNGTYSSHKPIEKSEDFSPVLKEKCGGVLGSKYYVYSYNYFFSTVTGVLVIALLLGITLGIAKRIFKLMILELIAPIPIMSLIDPKGSKDGAFSKWLGNLISTFVDLFVKLGLVYLIIVIIQQITTQDMFDNMPSNNGFFRGTYLRLFLILGLIFFAKEAPKFIKESLGIKDSGGSLFDDVKSVGKAAGLVGGAAVGTAGILGSGIASGRASYLSDEANGKSHHVGNILKNIGSGLVGAGAGAATAGKALTQKGAGISSVMKAQQARNAQALAAGVAGSTWLGRRGSEISNILSGETPATKMGRHLSEIESKQSLLKAITDRVSSEMPKSDHTYGTFGKNSGIAGKFNYKDVMARYEAAKATGSEKFDIYDDTGAKQTIELAQMEKYKGVLLKENEEDYLKKANLERDANGDLLVKDAIVGRYMEAAKGVTVHGEPIDLRDRGSIKGGIDNLTIESSQVKQKQAKAQANDRFSAKK